MEEIRLEDNNYPINLKKIKKPPEQLYVKGDKNLLSKDAIAVIGSRVNTPWGERIAKEFVKAFVENGLVVVSGMARGIDSIAHKSCIQYGGKTIAVLGSGLENIYPKENEVLFQNIIENNGLVVTEYEPTEPGKYMHFPARNRIISGLSLAVFVVEAAYRSGTSITAKVALEQGKKVYCLPQERETTKGVGTNHLLQIGAKLILKPEEIIEDLGALEHTVEKVKVEENYTKEEKEIFFQLQKGNRTPTQLSIALGKPIFEIQSRLMRMELEEKVEKDSLGRIIKVEK